MRNLEIERKFLVKTDTYKAVSYKKEKISQGYLSSVSERTVRVRVKGDKAFMTVKGKGNATGTTRFEWEKEITIDEATDLFYLCEPGILKKTRYLVKVGNHVFEVDEFHGENKGLVVAEIELEKEDEPFEKPNWLANEVTGEVKYYNSQLIHNPYSKW